MKCPHTHEHTHEMDDLQRRWFLQTVGTGLLTAMLPAGRLFAAEPGLPQPLPAGRSVYHVSGHAWVNGNRIDENTHIGPSDTIKTAVGSKLVFAVGTHAMLLRGGSHLVLQGDDKGGENDSPLIHLLRLFSGALLSVSRRKGMQIETPATTIGVRGTGVYLEAGPDKTYFCDCYGDVDVAANHDAASKDSVESKHHDRPLYIFNDAQPGKYIRSVHDPEFAPRSPNHSDAELEMIEALVGRTPPFKLSPSPLQGKG
jgi:hypothetical protein